jgi:hypothetical protein
LIELDGIDVIVNLDMYISNDANVLVNTNEIRIMNISPKLNTDQNIDFRMGFDGPENNRISFRIVFVKDGRFFKVGVTISDYMVLYLGAKRYYISLTIINDNNKRIIASLNEYTFKESNSIFFFAQWDMFRFVSIRLPSNFKFKFHNNGLYVENVYLF